MSEVKPLEQFRFILSEFVKMKIKQVQEHEFSLPINFDIIEIRQMSTSNELVKEAIIDVLSEFQIEANVYRPWISFYNRCSIRIIKIDTDHKLNWPEKYS